MFQRTSLGILVALVIAMLTVTGCGNKPAAENKTPVSQIGIINVQKAVQNHPRYSAYQALEKEFNTLRAQAETQQYQSAGDQGALSASSDKALAGIHEALGQEFNAAMTAKEKELNTRLAQKAEQLNRDLSAEFESYGKEIDQTYQPQIFSLQLKLKTVQLTKEEADKLQKQLEALQAERAAKLSAKEQELTGKMDAQMGREKAAAGEELNAYAAQLNAKLEQQGAAKSSELASRMQVQSSQAPSGPMAELQKKLMLKEQEIGAMQDAIIRDIQDKAGKIAAARNLEVVLGEYSVNIQAIDITDEVIGELKK